MATQQRNVRGLDPLLFEEFRKVVLGKYNSLRNKHSNIAREINELIRLYVESDGEIVARTHKPPKERIIDEIDTAGSTGDLSKERLEIILDSNHIVDERTREQYAGYGRRLMDRMLAGQLGVSVSELHRRRSPRSELPGYE
jgi:hypothetical protein